MTDLLPWLLLAFCFALLVVAIVAWRRADTRVRRNNLARQRVAAAGEQEAESVLALAGYAVVDRQPSARWTLHVDGEPVEVLSRADLIVSAAGLRYVAEVKTGARAPDPARPATRRQLLEYLLAFPVEGVLLVDMDQQRVHRVEFPEARGPPS